MAGGVDRGLSNSMWASDRRYQFKTSTTTITRTQTSTDTYAPPTPARPSSTTQEPLRSLASNGTPTTATAPFHIDFNSALGRIPTPWAELARHTKIVRRLKWKLPFLACGYNAATDCALTDEQRAEAELMFKLDFFEYYMLIERALVHLLGVFGIKITGTFGTNAARRQEGQSDHRFHANVLEALDDFRNPLHEALGKNDARLALARAKELRNRWKNADEPDAILAAKLSTANTRPLEEYDLERMLEMISAGFDHGFRIAGQYVAEVQAFAAARGVAHNVDMTDQSEEWEFMTDAMDWEAV
ncbi:unnamed protein product [Discula destructiva]